MSSQSAARSYYRPSKDGVHLFVRVTPRSQQDKIFGLQKIERQERLLVRLHALPNDGEANNSLCRLIARWLEVPNSAIKVVSGRTQRNKKISVAGDVDQLKYTIENCVNELS